MSNLTKKSMLFVGMATALASLPAMSSSDQGPVYINGAIGAAMTQPRLKLTSNGKVYESKKSTNFGYRIGAGYRISPMFGAELFYSDLGKSQIFKDKALKNHTINYKAAGLAAIISPFEADTLGGLKPFLEVGAGKFFVKKPKYILDRKKDKKVVPVLGLGFDYAVSDSLGARVLAEAYDRDAALLSLGLSYSPFASTPEPMVEEPVIQDECVPEPPPPENPDTDGDGVMNAVDCCPNTASGLQVNQSGCPVLDQILKNITFEYKSDRLTPSSQTMLDSIVEALNSYSTASVELSAHTDNVGSNKYNEKLSAERARSTMKYLVSRGISADRLTASGYGETAPIASNATEQGRAENRRVEIRITDRGEGATGCSTQ